MWQEENPSHVWKESSGTCEEGGQSHFFGAFLEDSTLLFRNRATKGSKNKYFYSSDSSRQL
jgi:hypothetical protein